VRDECALRALCPGGGLCSQWRMRTPLPQSTTHCVTAGGCASLRRITGHWAPATAGIVEYLRAIITAREILHETLWEGEVVEPPTRRSRAHLPGLCSATRQRPPHCRDRQSRRGNQGGPVRRSCSTLDRANAGMATTQGTTILAPSARFEIPGRQLAVGDEKPRRTSAGACARAGTQPKRTDRVRSRVS